MKATASTESLEEGTEYPWWWETTKSPWQPTERTSRDGRWRKADWWKDILKPKRVDKVIKLFKDFDVDDDN